MRCVVEEGPSRVLSISFDVRVQPTLFIYGYRRMVKRAGFRPDVVAEFESRNCCVQPSVGVVGEPKCEQVLAFSEVVLPSTVSI